MQWICREHVVNMSWTCCEHVMTIMNIKINEWMNEKHVLNMLWTCCEHVVNMLWTCREHVVNMLWTCREHVVNMSWTCFEHVVNMSWTCCEHVVNMSLGEGEGSPPPHIIWPYTMFCVATLKNLPNLVIYEIRRKNLTDRRTGGQTDTRTCRQSKL